MDWVHLIAAPAVSALIGAIVAAVVGRVRDGYGDARTADQAERAGIIALLRSELTDKHTLYVDRGAPLSLYERENIVKVHEAYQNLGGNDIGDQQFVEIMALPISD